jgi:O-antigen/teichoic acid export membrane protein
MSEAAPLASRTSRPPSLRRDLFGAYLATGAKVGSWALVSAIVFRIGGAEQFAVLALVRGTIGLLNYISLGLAPALVHNAARADAEPDAESRPDSQSVLGYHNTRAEDSIPLPVLYCNALFIAAVAMIVGGVATVEYGRVFNNLYNLPSGVRNVPDVVVLIGLGTLLRLIGDAPGAVLQVRGLISLDSLFVATGDCLWAVLSVVTAIFARDRSSDLLAIISAWYLASAVIPLVARTIVAHRETGVLLPIPRLLVPKALRLLLVYGSMVVLAQLADYLYAPTDYILIDRLLEPIDIAHYAPALQIDSALLLLVAGLSSVLLPRAAVAHAQGDRAAVTRYYVRGTLASLAMLAGVSAVVWGLSPWIFRIWLGNSMPETRRILPLLLVCTTLGGSSAVGRSILLAVGRVKPFTVSVLIAGVTNVVCSVAFVRVFHWGLAGIVLGTVVAVVGRCVVWMPWYILKVLAEEAGIGEVEDVPRDTGL